MAAADSEAEGGVEASGRGGTNCSCTGRTAGPGCCGCAVQAVSLGKSSKIQSLATLSISSIFSTLFFLSSPSISTVTGKDFNTLMEFILLPAAFRAAGVGSGVEAAVGGCRLL